MSEVPTIIKRLLFELEKLAKYKFHYAIILICGVCGELIFKENLQIYDTRKPSYEKQLINAFSNKKISKSVFAILEDIRVIRNKYIHIDNIKILDDWGIGYVDEYGMIGLANDIALRSFSEKDFEKTLLIHMETDARATYQAVKALIKELYDY